LKVKKILLKDSFDDKNSSRANEDWKPTVGFQNPVGIDASEGNAKFNEQSTTGMCGRHRTFNFTKGVLYARCRMMADRTGVPNVDMGGFLFNIGYVTEARENTPRISVGIIATMIGNKFTLQDWTDIPPLANAFYTIIDNPIIEPNKWYTIEIIIDYDNDKVDIIIDGIKRIENYTPRRSFKQMQPTNILNSCHIECCGDPEVGVGRFDDIEIYIYEEVPTPQEIIAQTSTIVAVIVLAGLVFKKAILPLLKKLITEVKR